MANAVVLRDVASLRYLIGAAIAVGIAAWVYAALGGDRQLASMVFISAWGIVVTAVVAGALVQKDGNSPLAAPLKVAAIGFAIAAVSGIVAFIVGAEEAIGFEIGLVVMLIGIGWAILRLTKRP